MSKIRQCFESRWSDGFLMEVDYSQLEIIALAFLSQDPVLMEDVATRDMHCVSASLVTGTAYEVIKAAYDKGDAYWTKVRKAAKVPSFQLQYGAGAKALAKCFDGDVKRAKAYIEAYYNRYQVVREWQQRVAQEVNDSRRPSDRHTQTGLPSDKGSYRSITGREYVFYSFDAPSWASFPTSFSPTQLKNYPVQGFATGDIVPMVLGKLYKAFKSHPILKSEALLINTVHDSILFDVRSYAVLHKAAELAKEVMELAPQYLEESYGIEFDLELNVGIDVGKSWFNMEPYKLKS